MKQKGGTLIFALGAVFVFTGIALAAQQKPTTVEEIALYQGADRQQILEEGARKEGKITFYTSHIENRPLVEAFQKKYPYLKVEVWRASDNELIARILEEHKASKELWDVFQSTQHTMLVLQARGVFQQFYSPELAYIQESALTKAPGGGVFRAAVRESGVGIGYNTKLIAREELPKTYQDLLDPKWKGKGKVAIGLDTSGRAWMQAMLVTLGEDFVRRIVDQNFDNHMLTARGILNMVINGEYMFSPTMYDSHVSASKKKGAPVDWSPLEPVPVNLGQIALPRHSSNPYAALLFIDFEFSKEAADIYKITGYSSTRKGITGAKTYKKFTGAKSAEEEEKWDALFNRLFMKKLN